MLDVLSMHAADGECDYIVVTEDWIYQLQRRFALGLAMLALATLVQAATWSWSYAGVTVTGTYSVGTCSSGDSGPLTLQPGETGTICNDTGSTKCLGAKVGDGPWRIVNDGATGNPIQIVNGNSATMTAPSNSGMQIGFVDCP